MEKPLLVEKIQDGTVIDHIDAGVGLRVLQVLGIPSAAAGSRVALVMNVPSKSMGKKDILKIENLAVTQKDADRIALISPRARLNIIKGGKVAKKLDLKMPESMSGIAKCPNPRCVTNSESSVQTFFKREGKGVRCGFCERFFNAHELL